VRIGFSARMLFVPAWPCLLRDDEVGQIRDALGAGVAYRWSGLAREEMSSQQMRKADRGGAWLRNDGPTDLVAVPRRVANALAGRTLAGV